MEANSTLVIIEVIKMMTGLVSVFYEAWQPITKKSIVHAEELLLRAKNNLQTFPIVVYVHLKPQFRLVVKLWEIMLAKVRLETHSSFKQVNFYPDDILPLFGDITKLMKNEMIVVEYQEFAKPGDKPDFPKPVTLNEEHLKSIELLENEGVKTSIDDIDLSAGDSYPWNKTTLSQEAVLRASQFKLDIKQMTLAYQTLPVLTNKDNMKHFEKFLQMGDEAVQLCRDNYANFAEKIHKVSPNAEIVIELSVQDILSTIPQLSDGFVQGDKTNDWGWKVSESECAVAWRMLNEYANNTSTDWIVRTIAEMESLMTAMDCDGS